MRTFDQTGKNFLANYLGDDYANILQNLEAREAVFYGKASSCENPVHVRLNDQEDFRKVFRDQYPPPDISDIEHKNDELEDFSENDDDLPF